MGSQLWCYISLSRYIIQVSKMLHLFVSTFRHGALISSYISKWWLRAANEMGSQLWCYISLSRYIIQVCKMLHLSGSTFPNGALISSHISKWWLLHVQSEYLRRCQTSYDVARLLLMAPIDPWRNSAPDFGAAAFCTTKIGDLRTSSTLSSLTTWLRSHWGRTSSEGLRQPSVRLKLTTLGLLRRWALWRYGWGGHWRRTS